MKDSVSLSKKTLYITVAVVIILVLGLVYAFKVYPEQAKKAQVNDAKKAVFENSICIYSCPIVNETILNKTKEAPEATCLESCSATLKAKNIDASKFSDEDLINDDFIKDFNAIRSKCNNESINQKTGIPSLEVFASCSLRELQTLKDKYSYLN